MILILFEEIKINQLGRFYSCNFSTAVFLFWNLLYISILWVTIFLFSKITPFSLKKLKYIDVSTHQYWKLSFPMKRSNNDNSTKESIFCVWIEFNTLSIFQYVEQCTLHFGWKGGIDWFKSHEKLSKKDKLLRFCQNQSDGLLITFVECHFILYVC